GMALRDVRTAVVHYTTPGQTDDVLSSIDLVTGSETIIRKFVCDISMPGRPAPPEHHGGNPTIGADGSIFFGIGDYGGGAIAQIPEWNGGKIWRVIPDGTAVQFALGFRNPFGMAWDAVHQRLIVGDNGPAVDDEIDVVTAGGNYGWPYTVGNEPPIADWVPPLYVFPRIVAPTGLIRLSGRNSMLPRGYLLGAFVTKAIYYIPDIDARPFPDPIAIIEGETGPIVAVAEGPNGDVYFGTGSAIYRLIVPVARREAVGRN
ncbi:MAG TPA: PQQ-dependent sugar dehydrogenase, partial [Thermoanaerobaculia bacterium]|nr:PQQ-dependent sugar dehydrogenase [Thermoanaerobaculia bacterium]